MSPANAEAIGIWQLIPSPMLTSVLLSRNLDFVIIDFEHGSASIETLMLSVFAAKASNKKVYARVHNPSSSLVSQILDTDVDGILFAHIECLEDVLSSLDSIALPPRGKRSYTPYSYAFAYNHPTKVKPSPDLGILIESLRGIHALPEMLSSAKVDFVYFGAYDLSAELGQPGEIFDPTLLKLLAFAVEACIDYGVSLWALARNSDEAELLKANKVNVIVLGVDTGLIADAASFSFL
jgi:2-keto-3-deoxy-L-rhamnonate aldolase RhmA